MCVWVCLCVSVWASIILWLAATVCSSQGDPWPWSSSLGFIFSSARGSTAGQQATVRAASFSPSLQSDSLIPPPYPPPPSTHTHTRILYFTLPAFTYSSLFYSKFSCLSPSADLLPSVWPGLRNNQLAKSDHRNKMVWHLSARLVKMYNKPWKVFMFLLQH